METIVNVGVNALRIRYTTNDVTDKTTSVWVGEKIVPSVFLAGPGGVQIVGDPTWTVAGSAVAMYDILPPPATGANPTSAFVVPLTDYDLTGTSIGFYWTKIGQFQVAVTAQVTGPNINRTTTSKTLFHVHRPDFDVAPPVTSGINIWENYDPPDGRDEILRGLTMVQLGDWNHKADGNDIVPGIRFSSIVNDPDFPGVLAWVQVVDTHDVTTTFPNGDTFSTSDANGLDTTFPYAGYDISATDDSPGNALLNLPSRVERTDVFSMYLMYKPRLGGDSAIWVPLTRIRWSWHYVVTSSDGTHWSFVGTPSVDVGETEVEPDLPQWTHNAGAK